MRWFVPALIVSIFCGLSVCQPVSSVGEDWQHEILQGDCDESQQENYQELMNTQVDRDHSFLHHVTAEVEYSGENIVRCIKVDNLMEEHGGDVAIESGGLGQKSLKLTMKSKLSHSLSFKVLILGDKDATIN